MYADLVANGLRLAAARGRQATGGADPLDVGCAGASQPMLLALVYRAVCVVLRRLLTRGRPVLTAAIELMVVRPTGAVSCAAAPAGPRGARATGSG